MTKGLVAIEENLGQKSRSRKGKCHYCKKDGHWKNECKLLKVKKEKASNTNDTASVVEVNSEGEDLVLTVSTGCFGDAWVLDSTCFII